jgi:response regulator RpfG family c-di-GMP phosphodiesterase
MSDIISISKDKNFNARVKKAAHFIQATLSFYPSADDLIDIADTLQPKFLIISAKDAANKEAVIGHVQALRQFFPEAFILVVAEKKIPAADTTFIKKSGCNFVMLDNEFETTIRLEYVLQQIVKAAYIPAKSSDFKVGSTIDFHVYTIMPLNQKILPVIQPGTVLSEARAEKLKAAGELYIKRQQARAYSDYLKEHEDKSAKGLMNRCRAQFFTVAYAHTDLIFNLTDQAESASYDEGKRLLKSCMDLAKELLIALATIEEPWGIIDQSTFGMIGATDRSIMIASMSALLSFQTNIGNSDNIMMAGLFCDIGLLDLSPACLGKIDSEEGRSQLNSEDLVLFQKHPILSINRLLERKMPLSEEIKEIIHCTHENADQKGFPRKILPEKIPLESMFIHFAETIDLAFRIKFGKAREPYPDVRKRVYLSEKEKLQRFNLVFLERIRNFIL